MDSEMESSISSTTSNDNDHHLIQGLHNNSSTTENGQKVVVVGPNSSTPSSAQQCLVRAIQKLSKSAAELQEVGTRLQGAHQRLIEGEFGRQLLDWHHTHLGSMSMEEFQNWIFTHLSRALRARRRREQKQMEGGKEEEETSSST